MTLEDLAAKLDAHGAKLDARGAKLDAQGAKLDAQGAKLDAQGAKLDSQGAKLDALDKKMDQGFNDSKIRDERLEGLMKFGLEAREVLRDEMHRRFDDTDRKQDAALTILKDASGSLR